MRCQLCASLTACLPALFSSADLPRRHLCSGPGQHLHLVQGRLLRARRRRRLQRLQARHLLQDHALRVLHPVPRGLPVQQRGHLRAHRLPRRLHRPQGGLQAVHALRRQHLPVLHRLHAVPGLPRRHQHPRPDRPDGVPGHPPRLPPPLHGLSASSRHAIFRPSHTCLYLPPHSNIGSAETALPHEAQQSPFPLQPNPLPCARSLPHALPPLKNPLRHSLTFVFQP